MFDNLKGLAAVTGVLKDLPRIKARMVEVRLSLGEMTVQAETGGGAVRVKATGLLRVVSVEFDQALLACLVDAGNPDDRVVAEDLVAGAVNTALQKALEMAESEMSKAADDLGLPLPPGVLGKLMG